MMSTTAPARKFSYLCFFLLLSQTSHAQFQGRLFTTEEERTYLDALRANFLNESHEQGFDITVAGPPPLPEADQEAEEPATPVEYIVGGILTRSDGSRTVWLNDQPIAETALPSNMKLVPDGLQVSLQVSAEGRIFQLKPGQTLNLSSGNIVETYQRGPVAFDNQDTPNITNEMNADNVPGQLQPGRDPAEISPESDSTEASAEGEIREAP